MTDLRFPTAKRHTLPWLLVAGLLVLLPVFISVGWWRAAGVGPQVQVPMFYDAHYLFPRSWTQAQEAPGVPPPAPLALYGPNQVSQPFVARADRLAMVELWLAGPEGTTVTIFLVGEPDLVYTADVYLRGGTGTFYQFAFRPIQRSRGRTYWLTLSAVTATADQPVAVRTVGGDRLGGPVWLNEYNRPGNLELYTYSRGWPGRWWVDALAEQLLPSLFRLRVQQYKPDLFKGSVFPILLVLMALLTTLFLLLARPSSRLLPSAAGWGLAGLLVALLAWQLGSGRLQLPGLRPSIPLALAQTAPAPMIIVAHDNFRVVNDLSLTLWTAERLPEARFVTTEHWAGFPAIRVPAQSALHYAMTLPLNGRFQTGLSVAGEGTIRFLVRFGEQALAEETLRGGGSSVWLDLDLSPYAGQDGALHLVTEPVDGTAEGLWLMPQLQALTDWVWPDPLPPDLAVEPGGYQFNTMVELVGYHVDPPAAQPGATATVTLYWRARQPTANYATVFVHLLDEAGQIRAQHDAQPVANTYPLPNWPPGAIIADSHPLSLPADMPQGIYRLAVGLYDPISLVRWPVVDREGTTQPDGRILLPTSFSVE